MIDIEKELDYCRYSGNLSNILNKLGVIKILDKDYESDYQGCVDISALLSDGRVFSYMYNYGSCSGCDEWEDKGYSDDEIEKIMMLEATFFDDENQYIEFKKTRKG